MGEFVFGPRNTEKFLIVEVPFFIDSAVDFHAEYGIALRRSNRLSKLVGGNSLAISSSLKLLLITPLFQIVFLPDLMQVKVLFPTTEVIPAFEHLAPALVAAFTDVEDSKTRHESVATKAVIFFFMPKE